MTEKYFNTQCTEVCQTLVDMAKENGWTGTMFNNPGNPEVFHILAFRDSGSISGCTPYYQPYQDAQLRHITLAEAIDIIKAGPKIITKELYFTIQGEKVVVDADCVKVGCETVKYEQVEEIYNAMKELRNNN